MTTGLSLRGRLRGDDLGHEPEPRGHHPRAHPGHAARSSSTTRCSPTRTARSTSRPGTTPRQGKLDPFVLIVEGSIPQRGDQRRGPLDRLRRRTPTTGQPITTNEWVDRLRHKAAAVVAIGTCATYGGIPAMKNNPTGAMGLPDYLGWNWKSKAGLPGRVHPGLPGPARQHDRDAAVPGAAPRRARAGARSSTSQLRPKWLFGRTVRESCNRAGFYRAGRLRDRVRLRPPLPGEARLQGARWSSATCRSAAG